MKKFVILLILCIGVVTPKISSAEHPSSVYYHRSTTYDVPPSKRVYNVNDFYNITSGAGTIIWDTFRISVLNLTSFFDKFYAFPCGIGGTFDNDVWFSNFCDNVSKDLTKQYKEMRYIYSNYGDKHTMSHKLTLDVPSLVVNLLDTSK